MIEKIVSCIAIIAFGISLIALYTYVARKRFGANIDFIQAIMYSVDISTLSVPNKLLELLMRLLKFVGLISAICGVIAMFL